MQTKQQIEQAFRAELQALLDNYGAEIEAKDHFQGYAECGEDVRMTVDIPGVWDKDGDPVREWTEIDLGSHLWPTPNVGAKRPLPENDRDDAKTDAGSAPLERPVRPLVERLRAVAHTRPEPEPFEHWRETVGLCLAAADALQGQTLQRIVSGSSPRLVWNNYAGEEEAIPAVELQAGVRRLCAALHDIAEEWAGAECGEPVHAQEAYAIGLAKRMYGIAADALRPNVRAKPGAEAEGRSDSA